MTPPCPSPLVRDEIERLPTYNAGLAAARFEAIYGVPLRAKLDSNENPLGPSPDAKIGRAHV